jgi:putative hemolysin
MMLSPASAVADDSEPVHFSYSSPEQPLFQKALIRAIEVVGGQRRITRLYETQRAGRRPDENFFDAAIRYLQLDVAYDLDALSAIPKTGPVVIVANHPYGVLDGIVLASLALKVRPDTKVLANDIIFRVPELRPHMLPIAFGETRQSLAINIASRRTAQELLAEGGCIGIFPAGGVATSERALSRPVLDLPWHPFTAKLVRAAQATVVPVHFSGQNSRLFQLASHLSLTLRLSLLVRETVRLIGTRMDVTIGAPLPFETFAEIHDKTAFVEDLRRRTYELAPTGAVDWRRYGRIRGIAKPQKAFDDDRRAFGVRAIY